MKPLRILTAADVPPDPHSGAAGTELQTAEALRRLGHEVDCIWTDDLPHRIRHGNLHRLIELPRGFRDAVAGRCAERDYDVIHVNQPYAWLAAKHHRRSGRDGVFVNRTHGWEPRVREVLRPWRTVYGEPEWRFPRGLLGRPLAALMAPWPARVARYADGVIASCSDDAEYIRKTYDLSKERVACIPQAAPEAYIGRAAPPMTEERLRRVLYVGQFAFVKAPQIVAAVFNALAECPAVELTWCCSEAHHDAARALLSDRARERVAFAGWMDQAALIELYDRHGVFLFPSFFEGFGKAFLEAMARGLCVVASEAGGMRDVIESDATGQLVPIGDVGGFIAATRRYLDEPARGAQVSQAAAAAARAYTWDRVGRETAAFYRALLRRRREA